LPSQRRGAIPDFELSAFKNVKHTLTMCGNFPSFFNLDVDVGTLEPSRGALEAACHRLRTGAIQRR
jgi:hypothetical protein